MTLQMTSSRLSKRENLGPVLQVHQQSLAVAVPQELWLEGNSPEEVAGPGGWLNWQMGSQGTEVALAKPVPDLLQQFLDFRGDDFQSVVGFARKWGPLGICVHGLPSTHSALCKPQSADGVDRRSHGDDSATIANQNAAAEREFKVTADMMADPEFAHYSQGRLGDIAGLESDPEYQRRIKHISWPPSTGLIDDLISYGKVYREPIAAWQHYSNAFAAVLELAMRSSEETPHRSRDGLSSMSKGDLWKRARSLRVARTDAPMDSKGYWAKRLSKPPSVLAEVEPELADVAMILNDWIRLAAIEFHFEVATETGVGLLTPSWILPGLPVKGASGQAPGTSLFGVLVVELVRLIQQIDRLARCEHCGRINQMQRRLQFGERHYCDADECRREQNRVNQANRRTGRSATYAPRKPIPPKAN